MIQPKTLVVGGGIAGLTLAAALHQEGIDVELIERCPQWSVVGAGMAVQGNAMRTLRSIGLDGWVAKMGTILPRWGFYDHTGELLYDVDLEDFWHGVGPCIGIARVRLQEALLMGAAPVPFRLATTVISLSQEEGHVSVKFSDGSSTQYELVVGADGIASSVRGLAFSSKPPVGAGHIAWRSIVPMRPEGLTDLRFFFGERCFFGLCPVGNGYTYGFGHVAEPRFHDEVLGRLQRLRSRFADFPEPVQEYLAALECDEQIHCSTVEWLEQEQWYEGRIALIGDAAHATSPMIGQGGCLAIEDAYVFVESLRSAESIEGALEAFAVRRRPRVKWVQQESLAVSESLRLPPEARNAILRTRGREMFERRFAPLLSAA